MPDLTHNPVQMAQQKLKYNINHQLGLLPRTVTLDGFIKILEKEHGISRRTFYRDREIEIGSDQSIPNDRLEVYAGLFGVDINELTNSIGRKKIKPISKRPASDFIKKIGLKPAKQKSV